jgi:hypothetical protein
MTKKVALSHRTILWVLDMGESHLDNYCCSASTLYLLEAQIFNPPTVDQMRSADLHLCPMMCQASPAMWIFRSSASFL